MIRRATFLAALCCAASAAPAVADDDYTRVLDDLTAGSELQDVADRAYEHSGDYWEFAHGHERDGHDHPEHAAGHAESGTHDGDDEELSAGEAVSEIYRNAQEQRELPGLDGEALDIVGVTLAVVDAWPDCSDTFDAVRSAVTLMPNRAAEIIANVARKRDCNCTNGGLWLDDRVHNRIRPELRYNVLDVPVNCSCSQVAMYGGIAGLPENRAFDPDLGEEEKEALAAVMTERVQEIVDRVSAMQSLNGWECGCTSINIASSMQGIEQGELRDGVYEGLQDKYAEDVADRGLVVDSFGVVGRHPVEYWGDGEHVSQENVLRRKSEVYRGDSLILDPFHPVTEFEALGDGNHGDLGRHGHTSGNRPTDLFISEYIEGWNETGRDLPPAEREREHYNRVIEIYNGTDETIDLGSDQYFLEIYGEPGSATSTVATPPLLVKKTISLESDVTFEFDQADIRAEASDDLKQVVGVLNDSDLFSEILISGHTCDLGSDAYNAALSERRADAVAAYLREAGLKDVTIRTEGRGESAPRLPNTSAANRSRNRRVDITFVTREGQEFERTVVDQGPGRASRYEYTFLLPVPPTVAEVSAEPAGTLAPGEYREGEESPRQVIGLNGAIEPGETWVIAFDESDESLRDVANEVTGQLDFQSHETLVLRKAGDEMALHCRVHSYEHVVNYPPLPFVRYVDYLTEADPVLHEFASPN